MKNPAKYAIASIVILVATKSFSQGTIISNGDYESGVASPWEGCTVVSNSGFAEGDWFAQTIPNETQAEIFQYRAPSNPRLDIVYYFGFYARNGTPGYPIVYPSLSFKRSDDSFIHATVLESNQTVQSEWTHYSYIFAFGGISNETLSLKSSIHFEGGETNSEAFVDFVYVYVDLSSTRIEKLATQNGTNTLSIYHLAMTNRYWVQRSLTLADDSWTYIGEIDLINRTNYWSESNSNQLNKAFYRLKED